MILFWLKIRVYYRVTYKQHILAFSWAISFRSLRLRAFCSKLLSGISLRFLESELYSWVDDPKDDRSCSPSLGLKFEDTPEKSKRHQQLPLESSRIVLGIEYEEASHSPAFAFRPFEPVNVLSLSSCNRQRYLLEHCDIEPARRFLRRPNHYYYSLTNIATFDAYNR